ncbi:unnamed protein product [Lota lota]
MEGKITLKYSILDFGFTFLGQIFFVVDIALDVWAMVHLYREGDFIYLGILVAFLVGSSVLGQAFSWLWYRYDDYETRTSTEGSVNTRVLKILHLFQLGVYLRYIGVLEVAVRSFISKKRDRENVAVFLSHDLSMLRLIETFSESAPQLVLMLTIMLQTGEWKDPVTVLKACGSASAIACSVTLYHRSLRSFLREKAQQGFFSSLLYFVWNLLLIFPRLAALALFAHALPCYIFAHFLCCWAMLFFLAWCCKSTFMDSPTGEWLYRATVGLIWYFSWFNVSEGRTVYRCLLYHVWMLLDLVLLCGLAYWQTHNAPGTRGALSLDKVAAMGGSILVVYILGLLLKVLYYKYFHPKLGSSGAEALSSVVTDGEPLSSVVTDGEPSTVLTKSLKLPAHGDFLDGGQMNALADDIEVDIMTRCCQVEKVEKPENRRMKHLAQNFYS